MTEGEKVILALEKCTTHNGDCEGCPYADDLRSGHQKRLMGEALDLIKSLQEDIEIWKKRYKWVAIERKTPDDPNKEPNIVKVFTTEEMELREMKRDG